MTKQNLPPTKNVPLENYLLLQKENTELKSENTKLQTKITKLESQIFQLEKEISKLKSKRPHSGGIRID